MHDASGAYREFGPAVLGYLRAQRVDDPENVLGDVFLQVARDIKKFRGSAEGLRSWVFSIAHNRAVDARRREQRRVTEVAFENVLDEPIAKVVDDFDPALVTALSHLTDDQRDVVVLRFVADLSLEETAKLVSKPIGAVKATQHRALESLEKFLGGAVSSELPQTLTNT